MLVFRSVDEGKIHFPKASANHQACTSMCFLNLPCLVVQKKNCKEYILWVSPLPAVTHNFQWHCHVLPLWRTAIGSNEALGDFQTSSPCRLVHATADWKAEVRTRRGSRSRSHRETPWLRIVKIDVQKMKINQWIGGQPIFKQIETDVGVRLPLYWTQCGYESMNARMPRMDLVFFLN